MVACIKSMAKGVIRASVGVGIGMCVAYAQEAETPVVPEAASVNVEQAPLQASMYESPLIASVPEQDILEIEAVGIGVAPTESCSPAQAVALAKRAAIIDAYRHLGEQMYGIKINSNDTVQNMILKNSSIKTKLNAVIRGAKVRESACEQGICQVTMELKLDGKVWANVLGI